MTRTATLAEARAFVRDNALVFVAVGAVMILAYGYAITSFSLSADEDLAFFFSWTDNWIEQGRIGIPLLKALVGSHLPLPFYNLALSLVIMLVAGGLWAFLFTHAARPARVGRAGLLVFLVVFTTIPVNAYVLSWNTLNIEIALAWVSAAASVGLAWLWAVEDRGWLAALGSAATACLAAITFQDFNFVVIAGVLIVHVAYLLGRPSGQAPSAGASLRRSVRLFTPIVAGLVVAGIISFLTIDREGSMVEGYFAWGEDGIRLIVRRLIDRVRLLVTGSGFEGGWILIPTLLAGLALIVLVARRGLRERQWYPFVLLLLLSVLPLALSVAIGRPLPNRAMQALVLVAAAVWLLLPLVVLARRQVAIALIVAAVLFGIWNASITTQTFLTEQQTWEADREVALQIGERLVRQGWDGQEQVTMVTIGDRPQGPLELLADRDFIGFSLFNGIDGRRSANLMRLLGYPMRSADPDQLVVARERSRTMPSWPAEGSVVFEDDVLLVKFAEPG